MIHRYVVTLAPRSGYYLTERLTWTTNAGAALRFASGREAREFATDQIDNRFWIEKA